MQASIGACGASFELNLYGQKGGWDDAYLFHMNESPAETDPLEAFLAAYSPDVRALALKARALVLDVIPGLLEQVDVPSKLLGYGWTATYKDTVCVIMPLKAGVNLGFARGAELPDPEGLLTGTGKRARHVRLSAPAEVERPALRALLEAAAAAR